VLPLGRNFLLLGHIRLSGEEFEEVWSRERRVLNLNDVGGGLRKNRIAEIVPESDFEKFFDEANQTFEICLIIGQRHVGSWELARTGRKMATARSRSRLIIRVSWLTRHEVAIN
jgi:hypothetical protein